MATVIINNQEVTVGEHERLNGIQAAARAGVEIPHYCWHPGLSVVASCRMCLVETGTRNPETGEVSMLPKLVPACQTPAKDGTVFVTDSEKVRHARAFVEEALLIDHPIDCPICDKAGECYLQDYHFEHGQPERRADLKPFTSRKRPMGDTVMLFVDRCVMCSRCVRFCREVAGTSELMVIDRGSHEEIDVFPGRPLENKLSGNVVDLCPVGALGDRDFLYEQRVWFLKRHKSVCSTCSTGCSIWAEENQDRLYRLKPRENMHINKWWMCDEGRYGFHYVHDSKRLIGPQQRTAASAGMANKTPDAQVANGAQAEASQNAEWEQIFRELPQALGKANRMAVVLSPFLTVEEAYLLAKYARSIHSDALIAVGFVPRVGEDETFPGGFTIRAEKCPNRRGVEEIAKHFSGPLTSWPELVSKVAAGEFDTVWVTGAYPHEWVDDEAASAFAKVSQLIVQDIFPSPLVERANWVLPGAAFGERAGSYVNHADRLQSFDWAVRPPQGARTEGSVYWRLLGESGLYRPKEVLREVAATIPYFALAAEPIPELGVDLKLNLLASASAEPTA